MRLLPRIRRAWVLFAALAVAPLATAAEPLHQRIDRLIAAGYPNYAKVAAVPAADPEFLRRTTLDLIGTLPTVAESQAFLADRSADKRTRWIDRLLNDPAHARRMAIVFDVMWMERRNDAKVPRAAWEEFLRDSFAKNKPYDVLVREILSADGADPKTRPAAKFFLDRDLDPQVVTRDIGRLLLGRNLTCAQCHDHPLVDDYKQEHYYGIQAFFNRAYLYPNAEAPTAVIAEKAEGEVAFASVFDKAKTQKTSAPRMPGLKPILDAKLDKGKEYKVKPAKDVKPVPAYSRFARLAEAVTDPTNVAFSRNAANRVWAVLFGRGLVHPLDSDHSANPASHPELLDLLASELAANKFDLKWLMREIARSETYQLSSEMPVNLSDPPKDRFLTGPIKPLSPEQLAFAVMEATGFADGNRQSLGKGLNDKALYDRLSPHVPVFRGMFAAQPGQAEDTFAATLDQTLFLKHGGPVRNLIASGTLLPRVSKLTDPNAIADEIFLSVLTRKATEAERRDVADALKTSPDRSKMLTEVIWAVIASAEFRFNH